MSPTRAVSQGGNWSRTVADVEEIARLLNAGGRLLRKSGALLKEPGQSSRRSRSVMGNPDQRRMERTHAKQEASADLEEQQETASGSSDDVRGHRNSRKGATADVQDDCEKLIPGIPEDVAFNHILTKIGWEDLVSLSSVSLAWHRIITQREVYEARLRQGSTQTFLAVVHKAPLLIKATGPSPDFRDFVSRFYEDSDYVPPQFRLAISLYSPTANSWHLLPPIPQVNCGIPHMSACAFVAGRLYVLGGEGLRNRRCTPRKSVFVMDLAVGRCGAVWKQCASMSFGRSDFACSVIDGKIYVAGGWSHLDHIWIEAEVFDTEKNSWQSISSMPTPRLNYSVRILDKQWYFIGGSIFHSLSEGDREDKSDDEQAEWADVYDPPKNAWRRVEKIGSDHVAQTWVVINDELFSLHSDSIDFYDKPSESWRALMPNSWEVLESTGAIFCSACAAADVNSEVYAFVRWLKGWPYELTLLKSKDIARGLDSGIKQHPSPVWEPVKCPYEFNRDFFFLVPVEL